MVASLRVKDSSAERALGTFLDEHFYGVLHERINGFEYERVRDRKRQLEGMDVIVDYRGNHVIIDEKSALHYVNSDLKTFAFELSSLQKGHRDPVPGWLYNPKAKTNRYLLMWLKTWDAHVTRLTDIPLEQITPEIFKEVECVLVERSKIQRYLNRCGWNEASLMERAERFRKNPNDKRLEHDDNNELIEFRLSEQLEERPVNVLIKRDVLKAMALHVYTVTRDGIVRDI